jgi:hypothetical protein
MKLAALIIAFASAIPSGFGQCYAVADDCAKAIGDAYLVDPNYFLSEIGPQDVATFRAIWLKGHTYRIAVCTSDGQPAEWMVYDEEGTLLFNNNEFESAVQWDFLCEHTMHVQLVAKPNKNMTQAGCIAIVHGFKK